MLNSHKQTVVLSLGAGVQSSVLLLLACRGILPKPDLAIFADTQWEPKAVYSHLWWLAEQADAAGIPVFIGTAGNLKADALRSMVPRTIEQGSRAASMPLFTLGHDGKTGMIRRQCTKEYKLEVVTQAIRSLAGLTKGQRAPVDLHVTQWIGISIDEKQRMRVSQHRWLTNEYPLIGWPTPFLARPWSRADCQSWFTEHCPSRTLPRSSCIGCPFHSDEEWAAMRENSPQEFADACDFDHAIRQHGGLRGETFLHRSCVPLGQVDFAVPDPRQLSFASECLGMCGV